MTSNLNITDGKRADYKGAYDVPLTPNRVIVAYKFYNDFHLFNVWDSHRAYFVVRHKENLPCEIVKGLDLPETRPRSSTDKSQERSVCHRPSSFAMAAYWLVNRG